MDIKIADGSFKCNYQSCNAKCCRNIRGTNTVHYNFNETRPLHLVVKPDQLTISIDNTEKEIIEKIAKEKGINVNFRPCNVIVDDKNRINVLYWDIDHDDCPFINNKNECEIYNERPVICRMFPYIGEGNETSLASFCPEIEKLYQDNKQVNGRYMDKAFFSNEIYLALANLVSVIMINLANKNKIKLVKTSDILKRIRAGEKLYSFDQMIIDEGIVTSDFFIKINNLIKKSNSMEEFDKAIKGLNNSISNDLWSYD